MQKFIIVKKQIVNYLFDGDHCVNFNTMLYIREDNRLKRCDNIIKFVKKDYDIREKYYTIDEDNNVTRTEIVYYEKVK